MRVKDELKRDAIIAATVKLVNEIGFAAASVSKIAKEAQVSPATIYIYFKNKEDLLVSTYMDIKRLIGRAIVADIVESEPIRDILMKVWCNVFNYTTEHSDYFHFSEQFANSPYNDLVDRAEKEKYFEKITRIIQSGMEQKIIKNVPMEIITAFVFYPAVFLSNNRVCREFVLDSKNIELSFTLAWDAIKY